MSRIRPRAVLFDFDFTLGDASREIVHCARRAMAALGRPEPDAEAVRRLIGLPLPEIYRQLAGEDGAGAARFHELFVECADELAGRWTRLYPGVPEMLAALRGRGLSLGIVSTKLVRRIESVLSRFGLEDLFDTVVGIEGLARLKPHPDPLLLALDRLRVPAHEALYVGDAAADGQAARAAGVPWVAVLTGPAGREELERHAPVAVLGRVTELPDLLG